MNILLIESKPKYVFHQGDCMSLGLGYIAAVLEQDGHKVSVLDLRVQPDELLEKAVRDVDIVGVRAITSSIKHAWEICDRVKKINPNTITVLGGPHPTALPEESLSQEGIDIVARGEGEYTMAELCDRAERNQDFGSVRGISYRERDGNRIKHNLDRKLIENLDEIPFPAYHLFPHHLYGPTRKVWTNKFEKEFLMLSSRGCPYNCSFCVRTRSKYRVRSPQNVIDEMKLLIDTYKADRIAFIDDMFNLDKERAIEICNLIRKEGLDIKWCLPEGTRVNTVDKEFLTVAKRSGLNDIWYGIESGSQRVLNEVINKRTTLEQCERAVRLAREVGLKVGGFFVLGNPGETRDDMMKTIRFACKLNLDQVQFTIATPFPGSRLYEIIRNGGRFLITDWNRYGNYEGVFFEYGETTEELVKEMYKIAYRRFFLRPRYIAKSLINPVTYVNMPRNMKNIYRFIVNPLPKDGSSLKETS